MRLCDDAQHHNAEMSGPSRAVSSRGFVKGSIATRFLEKDQLPEHGDQEVVAQAGSAEAGAHGSQEKTRPRWAQLMERI